VKRWLIVALAGAVSLVTVPAVSAADHTLTTDEGVRLAGTSIGIVNEGTDLWVGDLGCHGHVVTNRFWFRQDANGILLADSPSGPLGKPPGAPHVFFTGGSPGTGLLAEPLPFPASYDAPLQPAHDRVVFGVGGGNTIFGLANKPTPSLILLQTIVDGPNGLALAGSWIGALSPTDVRIAQIGSTGPSILFQQNQPSSVLPSCGNVSSFDVLLRGTQRLAQKLKADKIAKVAPGLAKDATALAVEFLTIETALDIDDYTGVSNSTSAVRSRFAKWHRDYLHDIAEKAAPWNNTQKHDLPAANKAFAQTLDFLGTKYLR
jgi:hypothetical protein